MDFACSTFISTGKFVWERNKRVHLQNQISKLKFMVFRWKTMDPAWGKYNLYLRSLTKVTLVLFFDAKYWKVVFLKKNWRMQSVIIKQSWLCFIHFLCLWYLRNQHYWRKADKRPFKRKKTYQICVKIPSLLVII